MTKVTGCYRCGSEEGSETTLCPTCTQIRMVTRESPKSRRSMPEKKPKGSNERRKKQSIREFLLSHLMIFYFGIGLIVILFALRLVRTYMSAEIQMEVDRKYSLARCVDAVMKRSNENLIKAGAPDKICRVLQDECSKDEGSDRCKIARRFVLGEVDASSIKDILLPSQ